VKAKELTEGAISLAIYIIILLMFLYLPFFGGLFTFVLPFPFLYYTAKYNWKAGLLFFTASVILTFIVGSWIALPIPFLFGFVGFVLGWNIYHQREALITFSTSTLALLCSVVVVYIISATLFDMNFIKEAQTIFKEVMDQTISMFNYMGENTDQIKEQLTEAYDLIISLLPSLLILSSALMVLIIQFISYPILKRFGIHVKAAKPFREITLPKSLIWYFLITTFLSFIVEAEKGTFLYNVFINLLYLIDILFVLQAITFIFDYCYKKRIHKAWAIVVSVFIMLNPVFNQLAKILGIIDLGFELRKRIQ
jgi:uncharacterized protein YybS (DUF2232 family)